MLDGEVTFGLTDPTLAQGDELLTFGKGADGDRPFLEGCWHRSRGTVVDVKRPASSGSPATPGRDVRHAIGQIPKNPKWRSHNVRAGEPLAATSSDGDEVVVARGPGPSRP